MTSAQRRQVIVRSVCVFATDASPAGLAAAEARARALRARLRAAQCVVQTARVCVPSSALPTLLDSLDSLSSTDAATDVLLAASGVSLATAQRLLARVLAAPRAVSLHVALGDDEHVARAHVDLLLEIVRRKPAQLFNFCFASAAGGGAGSPFFPSTTHPGHNGFSIGLQVLSAAYDADSLAQWCELARNAWHTAATAVADEVSCWVWIFVCGRPLLLMLQTHTARFFGH